MKKKAQEVARYVLPVGTFAHLYHTISGLTLHRYHRLCQQLDVPTEALLLVKAMVAAVHELDPLFFSRVEDPLRLEDTLEYRTLSELGRVKAGGAGARAFVREFDEALGGKVSRLVDYKVRTLEGTHGTESTTRVLITTTDGNREWNTVGVAPNVIAASWQALEDAFTYGLLHAGVEPAFRMMLRPPAHTSPGAPGRPVRPRA